MSRRQGRKLHRPRNRHRHRGAAFADCRKLTEVYFEGDAPALGDGVSDGTTVWILYLEGTLGWESTYGGMSTAPWVKGIDRFRYIIEEGTATIIRYIGAGGDVIIPSSINGVPVTGIGNRTFEFRADRPASRFPTALPESQVLRFWAATV